MKTETVTNELVLSIDQANIQPAEKKSLLDAFSDFFKQTQEWKEKADGLVVTDVTQVKEMKEAREARLALKNIRVNTEHKRKDHEGRR